ncbi:MAG: hypothetical protein HYZ49_07960 [Chloroflexi bacterium]|nr:hypothetical protein [Chloroflexota bacterium]
MKLRLPVAVAVLAGLATLALYFIPPVTLPGNVDLRLLLVEWAATLGAVALLLGVLNLAFVHLRKISLFSSGWAYSIFLLLALVIMLGLGLLAILTPDPFASAAREGTRFAFLYIQTPVEASLAALLVVVMVLAGARLIYKRRNGPAVLFIIVTLILIAGLAPINLPGFDGLAALRDWVTQVPAVGGARGILLGIALGTVATGLRVILGADHPYGE